jgi:hypothetical protein
MQALFNGLSRNPLAMDMPIGDFLATGVMRRQALANMCEPRQLVMDFVPEDMDVDDDDTLGQTFATACELASDGHVWMVALDREDLDFVRQRLHRDHGFRLLESPLIPIVA